MASPTFTDITANGNLNLTTSTNLIFGGTTSLGEATSATDSGAYLIGVSTAGFGNSASTNVQDVLADFDLAISGAGINAVGSSANFIAKFQAPNTITNSLLYDNGTNVGVGTSAPEAKLTVAGGFGFLEGVASP